MKTSHLIALASLLLFTNCAYQRQAESRSTNEKFMQIQVGMDRVEVLNILGNPYKREVYGNVEFLIYETNYFEYSKEGYIPICLKNSKVVGWGSKFYDDVEKYRIELKTKPE